MAMYEASSHSIDAQLRAMIREAVASCIAEAIATEIKPLLAERTQEPRPDPIYLSVSEAARRLDVHPTTLRAWMRSGRLRTYRIGSRILRVRTDDLHAAMAASQAQAMAPAPDLDAQARAILERVSQRRRKA